MIQERGDIQVLLKRMIDSWMNRDILAALNTWRNKVLFTQKQGLVLTRALRKWKFKLLSMAFEQWEGQMLWQQRMARLIVKADEYFVVYAITKAVRHWRTSKTQLLLWNERNDMRLNKQLLAEVLKHETELVEQVKGLYTHISELDAHI